MGATASRLKNKVKDLRKRKAQFEATMERKEKYMKRLDKRAEEIRAKKAELAGLVIQPKPVQEEDDLFG